MTEGPSAFLSPQSNAARLALFGLAPTSPAKTTRSRALLLGEDGRPRTYRFDGEGLELGTGWRKVNIVIPLPTTDAEGNGLPRPSSETDTPFMRIKHKLKVSRYESGPR